MENLPALVGRRKRRQRADGFRRAESASHAYCNRSQRVQNIVRTDQRPASMLVRSVQDHIKLGTLRAAALYIFCPYVSDFAQSISHDLPFEIAAKLRNVFVVRIEHGGSTGGERLDQFIFRPRNAGDRIEKLQVHRSYVGHHANIRAARSSPAREFPRHATSPFR